MVEVTGSDYSETIPEHWDHSSGHGRHLRVVSAVGMPFGTRRTLHGELEGKTLRDRSVRKCDSPEHMVWFCLADMLSLRNDDFPLFILDAGKLGSNSAFPYDRHSFLLVSLMEFIHSHPKFLVRFLWCVGRQFCYISVSHH